MVAGGYLGFKLEIFEERSQKTFSQMGLVMNPMVGFLKINEKKTTSRCLRRWEKDGWICLPSLLNPMDSGRCFCLRIVLLRSNSCLKKKH